MRFLFLVTVLFSFTATLESKAQQEIKPIEMGTLPLEVDESSGLAAASQTSLWTINDRGGKAEVYEIDIRGELLRVITMVGISPIDMEDMAQDNLGNLYISDTGNNKQDRNKVRVYKFNVADIKNDSVRPDVIEFVLADKGLEHQCHYDIEAMTWNRQTLYFFTKDRCDKVDNSLFVYSIPDEVGLYTAENKGQFFWEDLDNNIKITGADISFDGKKLALLSNDAIHFFLGYKKDRFFNGAYRYIPLAKSKKEALVHLNDCDLYISEESTKGREARLWKLNLCSINFD